MKRIGIALVAGVGGILCAPGSAEGQFAPPVAPPGYVTAGPVMSGNVVSSPARRGLFGRLQETNTNLHEIHTNLHESKTSLSRFVKIRVNSRSVFQTTKRCGLPDGR